MPNQNIDQLPQVMAVTQAGFGQFILSHKFAIVLFGSSQSQQFLPEVLRYFAAEYPHDIVFGYLDQSTISNPAWGMKYVGRVFAGQTLLPNVSPDGYYLFANGQAVGFHPGPSKQDLDKVDLTTAFMSMCGVTNAREMSLGTIGDKPAKNIVMFFEGLIDNGAASLTNDMPEDPYTILGLMPDASDAEIEAVFRRAMKENHPDKVPDHLSDEIKRFATERSQIINSAYKQIRELRAGAQGS